MSHRSKVLAAFRTLHRARKEVFAGDDCALSEVRHQINSQFREKLEEKDESKIEENLVLANDVAYLLRTSVVQLRQKEPDDDTYELRITKNTYLPENTPFDPTKEMPVKQRKKKKNTKCADPNPS